MSDSRSWRYRVVDVFTEQALQGNALAVFPDAVGINEAAMQKIARELNLSETVFVLPPTRTDCVVSLRIFTPSRELPFAGHPTVGTSFVLLDLGLVEATAERFVLEEGVGPVPIRIVHGDRPLIWLRTPPISAGRTFDRNVYAFSYLRLRLKAHTRGCLLRSMASRKIRRREARPDHWRPT
jgi:trans-2,3-dihydro-3-hydroxyanthranilate isomerase